MENLIRDPKVFLITIFYPHITSTYLIVLLFGVIFGQENVPFISYADMLLNECKKTRSQFNKTHIVEPERKRGTRLRLVV